MKIAIPVINGLLSEHFGHCETFYIASVNEENKEITDEENKKAPPHEPGLLPKWLKESDVDVIIAGGMGQRAIELFRQNSIEVFIGVDKKTPKELVNDYINQKLETGKNFCEH